MHEEISAARFYQKVQKAILIHRHPTPYVWFSQAYLYFLLNKCCATFLSYQFTVNEQTETKD